MFPRRLKAQETIGRLFWVTPIQDVNGLTCGLIPYGQGTPARESRPSGRCPQRRASASLLVFGRLSDVVRGTASDEVAVLLVRGIL
jgi:hypothetical protein